MKYHDPVVYYSGIYLRFVVKTSFNIIRRIFQFCNSKGLPNFRDVLKTKV